MIRRHTKKLEKIMDNQEIISIKIPKTKMVSIFASSIFFFIIALVLWKQQRIDVATVLIQNCIYENGLLLEFLKVVSRFGMGLISAIYGFTVIISYRNDDLKSNRPLFLYVICAFAFGSISGDLMKELFMRARPAVLLAGQIHNSVISDSFSFPSGHAAKSLSLALPFIFMASNKNIINRIVKIILLLSSTLVCYSRIALQKHFPSDILAGFAVALLAVVIGQWIVNCVYRRRIFDEDKLQSLSLRLCSIFFALAIVLTII
jgi:membrane-associated phospholipid phosphatase